MSHDIICFEIVNINSSGITVKSGKTDIKICFDECAKNYANENSLENSSFVADISQFKVGFENSVTIWDTDKAMTYFSNASFTAAGLVALYVIPGSNNFLHNSYAGLQPCPVG